MKKPTIYLLIVSLIVAAITASILHSRWQHRQDTKDNVRKLRQAEEAFNDVFQLPSDMQRKPSSPNAP